MRKESFVTGEYYHVYNRGVDKRTIFLDRLDYDRFMQGLREFNSVDTIGSIYENSFIKNDRKKKEKPLVKIIAYCVNPNHYHFILEQLSEKGIEKFMQRLGMGYAKYFNNRYKRSGTLFQGKFKAKHIDSNEYLLHLSAYVNLNFKVHQLGHSVSKSSWDEYVSGRQVLSNGKVILNQFTNRSEYAEFSENSLKEILLRKERFKEMESILLD